MSRTWQTLGLVAFVLLSGCGGLNRSLEEAAPSNADVSFGPQTEAHAGNPAVPAWQSNGFDPFGSLPNLKAFSGEGSERIKPGSEFEVGLPHSLAVATDGSAVFTPIWAPDEVPASFNSAYCMYLFSLPGYSGEPKLHFSWQTAPADWNDVWVGLGNFVSDNWDLFPMPATGELDLGNLTPYFSPSGDLLALVMVLGTSECNLAWLRVGQNTGPTAAISADPTEGEPPLDVEFDASESSDLDGEIVRYEWDFEGDGTYEADTGATATIGHNYPSPGAYPATVRVTDDQDAQDTATVEVTAHGWAVVAVAGGSAANNAGWYTSMTTVEGCPAISCFVDVNDTSGFLLYARATTATGSRPGDWTQIVPVDTLSDITGWYTSLAVVDGNPAISYWDYANRTLRYARATTAAGGNLADWTQLVTVDDSGAVGGYTSLAVVDGNPAISYQEGSAGDNLNYARATTASGSEATDWTDLVIVDDGGPENHNVGRYSSLAVVDGNPAISYRDDGVDTLNYVRSTTATGASSADWSQMVIVDTAMSSSDLSLAVVAGNPAISYYDGSSQILKYARADTATGADPLDWSTVITIDAMGSGIGRQNRLAVVGGYPLIFYRGEGSELRLAQAATPSGSQVDDWSQLGLTDEIIGEYPAIAEVDGRIAISFHDFDYNGLKYAILF